MLDVYHSKQTFYKLKNIQGMNEEDPDFFIGTFSAELPERQ